MERCLRRALPLRALLSRRSPLPSPNSSPLSYLAGRETATGPPGHRGSFDRSIPEPFFVGRRGFAKGRKSKDGDDGDTVQVVPDIGPAVKSATLSQMDAAIVALSRDLGKLRTGRASAGMLDHLIIETSAGKTPLNHVAVVSVIDSKTLSVTPYDPSALKAVENAIVSSPLGLNPTPDGERLIALIPPLTKENMQALCKVVTKAAEDVKQSIRRARQKALDSIKKGSSSIPKDDAKRLEKEIEEMTKKFVKSADEMCKAKEKEISSS